MRPYSAVCGLLLVAVFPAIKFAQSQEVKPAVAAMPALRAFAPGSPDARASRVVSFTDSTMQFEANRGQDATSAQFLARGDGYLLRLQPAEAVLDFRSKGGAKGAVSGQQIGLSFVGANKGASIAGEAQLPGVNNYLPTGDPHSWHTAIPTFERVTYSQIYEGIDLSFYGNGRKLEYDVRVAPGADPALVRLALSGSDVTRIDADGNLVLSMGERKVRLLKPLAYQVDAKGKRAPIEVAYDLDLSKSQITAAFKIGEYDRTRPLVIDPVVDYSFYVANAASSGTLQLTASATDAAGNTYVAGNLENYANLVIAKFNAAGQQLFNTVLGTNVSSDTYPIALALDPAGNVYVTGYTLAEAPTYGFPTTGNAYQQTAASNGYYNAYLAVLKYDGSALTYATYFDGPNQTSYGFGVAVDSAGNAYISGQAAGINFPTTPGAFQTAYPAGASYTGFIAKFNPAASGAASLVYSTLLGANSESYVNQIAVDSGGSVYAVGGALGSGFPTTAGAYQYSGTYPSSSTTNVFVSKLNPSGSALVYSSLLGPGNGYGLAIDGNDDVYVSGAVGGDDFPTTSGAYQTTYPGGFVTELNPQGNALVYSTFLGGPSSGASEGNVIASDVTLAPGCPSNCNAYVSGFTTATDFPPINPIQNYVPGTGGDYAFLAELNGAGSQALFSSYFATGPAASLTVPGYTNGPLIGVDNSGNMYVTGTVSGGGLTVTQPTTSTSTQGFLAKVAPLAGANLVPVPLSVAFSAQTVGVGTVQQGYAQPTVLLENLGSAVASISSITFSPAGEFTETDNCGGSVPAASYCTLTLNFLPTSDGAQSSTMTIASTGGSPTVALTGTGNDGSLLTANPGSLAFPNTAAGSKSSAQLITIQNVGNQPAPLNIAADVYGAAFPYNTNCPAYLNPSQTCQISVVFAPIQPGYQTGTINNLSSVAISLSGTGTGSSPAGVGSLGVGPGSLNFGTEADGIAAQQQDFTLYNTGTLPVTVASATVALTSSVGSASDFQVQYCTGTPFTLVPQQTICFGVIFKPSGVGTETATLTIASSTGTPITVNLTGIGLAATQVLEFEPGNQVFPSQPLGVQSAAQSFYVYNTGTTPVLIDRVEVSGDFQITYSYCPGYTIPGTTEPGYPGGSCYLSVAFTPTALGARTGTLTLVDSAGSSQVLSLMGTGVAQTGTLIVEQSSLQFDPQVVGTTSGNDFISLSNPGNTALTLNSLTTTGDYAVSGYSCGTPPSVLAAGSQCQVSLSFTPTSATNPRAGTLVIGSTAGSQTIALTGTGLAATQAIAFTPATSLSFGSVVVSTNGYVVPIYVRNTGTESVTFSKVAAITSNFKINSNNCASSVGQQLAANASCEIDLVFNPTAVQSYTGTLTLTDTIAGATTTQVLNLSGTGVASTTAADMNPQPLQFTQQNAFTTSSPSIFYLYNYAKSATVTIASWSITMGGSNFIAAPGYDSCTGTAIPAKSYCTIGIEFVPQSGGNLIGSVTFTDTSGNTYVGSLAGYAPPINDAATLSPSALAYPTQPVGVTQSGSYTGNVLQFTNTGTTNITLGTLSGTDYGTGAEFFADSSWYADQCSGAILTPGQSCNVGVAFMPSSAGPRSGNVNFPVTYGDNTTGIFTASLAGTGLAVQNSAVVTPSSVTYTDQVVGTASGYQLIRLYNTGSLPFTVGKLIYSANPQFLTDVNSYGDQCSNTTVAAGSSCYIGVDFKPTATGAQTGTLTFPVTYSGASSAVNYTAALSGNGVAVANGVYLSPASVYLGQQVIGTTSSYQVISFLNRGDSPVTVGNITYSNNKEFGTDSSVYGDQCSQQTITVGNGCVVGIDFTPSASGARTSNLSFPVTYSSGTKTTLTAALTGSGLITSTGLTYSQTTVTFPSQQLGVQSQGVTVEISNPTQTAASFTLAVGGTNPGDFNVSGCGGVGAQSSCSIYVYFTPSASGARSATVTLSGYSGPGTTSTLTLKGTGAVDAGALSAYPSTLAFSTTEPIGVGTPGQVVTITNNGSVAASAITKVSTTDTAEFPVVANNCVGAALQPNQSCALTVVFSPTSTGAKTASISITPAQGAAAVTVSGTGTADIGSTVTLASNATSAPVGSLVTLTATVSASGAPVTNGSVKFYAGAKLLGAAQVVTTASAGGTVGNATLYTNSLPLGANSITATYAGADSPGTASPITVTITGQYASSNVLSSTGLQGSYSLLSTIAGFGPVNPTGSVTYNDLQTNTVLGTATVSAATATQSFYTIASPTVQPYPEVTALVDVNHDGKLDLITGYGQVGPTSLTVSLGNGDGSFQPPISVDSVNYTIDRLAFGDFNGDGNIDIVASTQNSELLVFLGKGNGTFGDAVGYGSGSFYGVAVADFNGDGKLDLVATDASNQSIDVMLGNGDGTFQDQATFPSPGGGTGQSLVVGDFNNDGKLDVAAGPGYNSSTGYYQVELLLGNGNGTLQTALAIPTTGYYPYQIAAGDVNGDGNLDIITNDDNNLIGVLTGKGTGVFNPEQVILTGAEYNNQLVADTNGDGKLDIVASNANSGLLYVALGNGNGTFGAPVGYPTGSSPYISAVGDTNGDGKPDIVVANYQSGSVTVLLNQVTETATLTGVTLPGVNSDNVSATYGGDTNYLPATSNVLNVPSNAGTGSTTLTVTPANGVLGTEFTMTARPMNSANAAVTAGTVTFYNGSTALGTVEIVASGTPAGTATLLTRSLPVGANSITARFNGTDSNEANISSAVAVTVSGLYPTATALSYSGTEGEGYTLNAVLSGFGSTSPTGNVVFLDNSTGTTLGTLPVTAAGLQSGLYSAAVVPITQGYQSPSVIASGDLNGDGKPDLVVGLGAVYSGVEVLLGNGDGTYATTSQTNLAPHQYGITAVALGDINGDGRLDLVVGWATEASNGVGILLGNGDGTFGPETDYSVSGTVPDLVIADLNGDGKLDLVASDSGTSVLVFIGNGDGTFKAAQSFTAGNSGASSQGLAVADFNGDGKFDIAVATPSSGSSGTVNILLGNGDGTFQTQQSFMDYSGTGAYGLVAGDFNGDGKIDLASSNYYVAGVSIFLGNGDGTLQEPQEIAVGGAPNSIQAGDFNKDGKLDIAVPNYNDGTISLLFGNGDGTFQGQKVITAGSRVSSLVIGDVNGDSMLDVVATNSGANTLSVLLGEVTEGGLTLSGVTLSGSSADSVTATYSGDASFASSISNALMLPSNPSATTTTLTVSPTSGAFGTVFTLTAKTVNSAQTQMQSGNVTFYAGGNVLGTAPVLSSGSAAFTTRSLQPGSDSLTAVFNGNSTNAPSTSLPVSVSVSGSLSTTTNLSSTGTQGNYTLHAVVNGFGQGTPTGSITFNDLTAGSSLGTAALNNSALSTVFAASTGTVADNGPLTVAVGDLNHDGFLDYVTAGNDVKISVSLGNGDGTFKAPVEYGCPTGGCSGYSSFGTYIYPESVQVADFNGDGNPDIITGIQNSSCGGAGLSLLLGNGDGTFQQPVQYNNGYGCQTGQLAVADLNGDGVPDVIGINQIGGGGGTATVYLGTGQSSIGNPLLSVGQTYSVGGGSPTGIAIADLNGDRIPDFVVTADNSSVYVLLGKGDGTFQPAVLYTTSGVNPQSVAIGDLNGDGRLDLVIGDAGQYSTSSGNDVSILLGNGDGTFQAAQSVPAPPGVGPTSIALADLNLDGMLDVVATSAASNQVNVYFGNGNGTLQSAIPYPTGGEPEALAIGDFNGDGRPDFIATNYGAGGGLTTSIYINELQQTAVLNNVSVPGTGTHNVSATYGGDTHFSPSTSNPIQLAATLAATQITMTPTPSNANITYGATLSVLVAVSGPTGVNNPTGTVTYTVAGGATQTATLNSSGTVTLNLSGLQAGTPSLVVNYAGDQLHSAAPQQTLAIAVNKAPLSVVGNNFTRIYGAANPTFSGVITGLQYSDTATATYATTATVTSAVGTYAIVPTVTISDPANYSLNSTSGVLTVSPASLTVTVANATKIYGSANPNFSDTLTGVQNNDAITVTLATTATTASPVGTYPITATAVATPAVLANYTQTVNNGTLTITHQPLTVTANNATRLYGAANPTFSGTVAGLQGSDTVTVTYASSATTASAVGTYSIVPTVSGAALTNYTLMTVNGVLSVTAAPLTVVVNNASRTYGASNPTFTGTVTGLLNGDTVTTTYSTTALVTSSVGTYSISASISGTKAGNYTATVTNGTLTVGAAPLTVTVNSISKVYGSTNPTFSGTVTGLENGDGITTTYSTNATQYSPVGTYPISATVSGSAASNYTATVEPGTLTVTQAILQIVVNNATRVYGSANPTFTGTVTGTLNNDNVVTTYATTATGASYVNNYPITATISGTAAGNYNPQVTQGSLSVTPAPLAVSVNASTKVYGATLPTFTTTYTTLLNGDVLTPTYSTTATTSSAVGSYSVTETLAGAALANYTATYTAGTLTVTPAPLSLTVANASRTYGATNPTLTGTLNGVVNGDTITPTFTTTAVASSPVGTYQITATLAGANLSNYTQTITPGILSITPASLTVTVANASRTYGASNPTFTGTITGLLNGDSVTVTYSTTAGVTTGVGSYSITAVVSGTAASNYASTVNAGTLTITPATLTIVVNNSTRVYLASNPTFTGTVAGLLNGDTVTTSYSTTATSSSAVGTYPITGTISGSSSPNYTAAVTPGSLTITALVIATPSISPVAGSYATAQSVTISDATSGVTIYYTTNGTAPTTSSSIYSGAINVSSSETIEAVAAGPNANYTQSAIASAAYTITTPTASAPVLSPSAGTYSSPQTVTMTDATAGASIYYTTNGATPTSSSTLYSGPITVSATETVKAIAIASGYSNSTVVSAAYTLKAATPTFTPAAGTFVGTQSVTIADATPGVAIYYTTNGTTPTTSSTLYSGSIAVSATETVEAIATETGYTTSSVASATYTLVPATPVFTPVAGNYVGPQSVTITDATAGVSIYYTTDHTNPTSASTPYTGPISISGASDLLKAVAIVGGVSSAVGSATYTIQTQVTTPVFTPAAGSYTGTQSIVISDTTAGSTIYYTTNGSTPTASSTVYTGPITVSSTETLKAIAIASGLNNSSIGYGAYTIQVPTPAFTPATGTYASPQTVTITDATAGAKIYYTTDGSTPTTSSTLYTGAITVSASETINAIAAATGQSNSAVANAAYTIQVATPVFSLSTGTYSTPQTVTISDATSNSAIYYTTNGSTPTTSSTLYTGAITVSVSETINAIAVATGQANSAVASAAYTIQAATPVFSPSSGTYPTPQTVTISDATSNSAIYYTTNGSTPTTSSTLYTGAITVSVSETINAIAVATGQSNSAVASAAYTIQAANPTFTPAAGTYTSPQTVIISDATSNAAIYYTTNGSTPTTSSTLYTGAITVSATETVNAIAVAAGYGNSAVVTAAYTITPPAAMPTFSPAGGSYMTVQTVTISDATPGVTIYYTTNGSTPTTSSTQYTGPITVGSSETLSAIASGNGYGNSPVGSSTYTLTLTASAPVLSPSAGTYSSPQTVTMTDATAGASIYYTTNGATPTSSSTLYSGPITVSATETVKAIAIASGYSNSTVVSAAYTLKAATPTFTPAAGTFVGTQSVTIADATPGVAIYYTTNGTTPTTSSTLYSGSIAVSATETVEAIATETGYTTSSVASATYTLVPATPVFTPVAGNYVGPQSVTITDATAGVSIYYTTDHTNPTSASTPYTGPISISGASDLLKAVAIVGGVSSAVGSATYTIQTQVTTPVFTPAAGSYTGTQSIVISDTTAGSTIYYTTNGSTPTASSTVYTGPITVSSTETLKAIAIASGLNNSSIGYGAYTIQVPTPAFTPATGTYASPQTVTITDATAGAKIYYTTDGSTPTTSSTLYTGAITVSASETINAIAAATGQSNSAVANAAYTIQ